MLPRVLRSSRGAFSTTCKKSMSTESPKILMAQNLLRLTEVKAAGSAEDLAKLDSSPLTSIDLNALPTVLVPYKPYFDLGKVSSSDEYIPDPTAWQNMSFWDFAAVEAQREETWPFLVGVV